MKSLKISCIILTILVTKNALSQVTRDTVTSGKSNSPMVLNPGKPNDSMVIKPTVPNDNINRSMSVLSDTAFLKKNILDNRLVIALATLGASKSKTPNVRSLATSIKNDHTNLLRNLLQIQKKYGIEDDGITKLPPDALPASESFDKNWAGDMLLMHDKIIPEMETFIGLSKNSAFKMLVMKSISTMKKNRDMLIKIPGAKEKVEASRTRTI